MNLDEEINHQAIFVEFLRDLKNLYAVLNLSKSSEMMEKSAFDIHLKNISTYRIH